MVMSVINTLVHDYMNWRELLRFCHRISSSLPITGNKFVLFFIYSIVSGKRRLKSVVEFMLVSEVKSGTMKKWSKLEGYMLLSPKKQCRKNKAYTLSSAVSACCVCRCIYVSASST